MENIVRVPMEMVKIIPVFDGDTRLLPLFIKKCEYILQTFRGGDLQNEYLFHVITSRLNGEAANLVGERELIQSWDELKQLLSQHFGDPRSEDCLAMELESLKRNRNESYSDFCHRIQHLRSVLFSKISETINDANLRQAKHHIYDSTSLNVFLFNLPAYLVRLVRLRNVTTLEDALKTVLEEQNFQTVYDTKNPRFNSPRNWSSNPPQSQNQSNFYPPRQDNSQRPQNSFSPNNAFNSMPIRPNIQNSSFQFRNNRQPQVNNRFNNDNNGQQWPRGSRSPQAPAHVQRQHPADNAPPPMHHAMQYQAQPGPSGSNTDVTMRTASSRRINYTENNHDFEPCYSQQCPNSQNSVPYSEPVENFHIDASMIGKK